MKNILKKFPLFNLNFSRDEQEIKHKVAFLNNVFFFAGIVAFFMGFIRWQESHLMGVIDFVFAGISFVLLIYLRQHKEKVELLSTLALALSFILFLALYLLAPYNTTRSSLFFLLSASAFFLKGRKVGFLWLTLILLSIISCHLFFNFAELYSPIDLLTLGVYLIALFFVLDNYETIKDEQQQLLEQSNATLEEEIRQRTIELQNANDLLMKEKQLLKEMSLTDQLTGLSNRYKLEELFDFESSQSLRDKTNLSIILMDIDHFKSINDSYGHYVGDIVLKEVALTLKESIRDSDIAVRWGGEEFIIISSNTTLEEARQLAESLRQIIQTTFYYEVGHVTASFGIVTFDSNESLISVIKRADIALYRAKELGRNNVQIEYVRFQKQFDLAFEVTEGQA